MLSREIEIFRVVMTTGSATKAARLMNLTQPAISQSLRRLEQFAGLELFQRTGGKLQPTPEARVLQAEVERHFVGMEVIEQRLRALRQFGVDRFRVASFPGLGVGFLPRVLADLTPERERMLVSLQIMGSPDVRKRILSNEADLGVVADDVSTRSIEATLFAHYFGVVALPAGHALARHRRITPAMLAKYPFIALPPEDSVSLRLDRICRNHGVELRTAVECSFTISQCELVRSKVGIAIVSPITACDYLHAGLVFRPFSERLAYTSLTVQPAGQPASAIVRHMLGAMRKRLEVDMQTLAQAMAAGDHADPLHSFDLNGGDDI
jgi:DNA-binding transcriptional LysR family regulator